MKELYRFKQITNRERLSQNTINAVLQDREGFMWFGTQDGLNRYDGNNFKIYKKNMSGTGSIPENFISSLYEDSDSGIWVGTFNSGLIFYDKYSDKFETKKSLSMLNNEFITSVTEDNDRNLWIGTYHAGLYKLIRKKDKLEKINLNQISENSELNTEHVMSLAFDIEYNKMTAGTWGGGIFEFDFGKNETRHYYHNEENENSVSSNNIFCIFTDSRHNLWAGSRSGLNRLNYGEKNFTRYNHDPDDDKSLSGELVKAICEDLNGNIWIGTYGFGLNRYDVENNNFVTFTTEKDRKTGFACDTIFSICTDRTNVLWIGTLAEGLLKLDNLGKKFFSVVNDNPEHKVDERNKIRAIYASDENNILIGTFNEGLIRYSREGYKRSFEKIPQISKKCVFSILKIDDENFWISNELHGLSKYRCTDNTVISYENILDKPHDQMYAMCINKPDSELLLLGTETEGLKIWDSRDRKIIEKNIFTNLNNFEIRKLYIDSENNLWVATHLKGLMVFRNIHISRNNIVKPDYHSFDCGNTVWCVYEDSEKNIWVGTAINGLSRIDLKNNIVEVYNEEKGLSNNCIHGILEDDDRNLWLSTNNGLSKFSLKSRTFKNYDTSDGLNNIEYNEGAYFRQSDGTMYFGGNDGITYFKPEEITDNPYIPNVVITEFEVFNQTVEGSPDNPYLKENIIYADEINLTYRESVFSFRFASLIYNNPGKNQYAYKMEGFDKEWTFCENRKRVTYTNLDPGDYVFRVKGSNNDGVWNEEGASVKIKIKPPYWKSWWFKSLGIMSLIAATGITYRQRLEKVEKERKAQEEFSRKLIELQEDERKRIASALHDTIAQDVTISKNKALMALRHKDDTKRMESALEEISEMASSTIKDVRNITYNLRPHQLDRIGFTKTINSIVNDVSKSTNIKFEFSSDNADDLLSKENEINLFRVIQETINNIMNHSKAKAAKLNISVLENHMLITISDNGTGFNVNTRKIFDAKRGFGLPGIAERIKLMQGELNIESEISKGTTIRIKIPINPK